MNFLFSQKTLFQIMGKTDTNFPFLDDFLYSGRFEMEQKIVNLVNFKSPARKSIKGTTPIFGLNSPSLSGQIQTNSVVQKLVDFQGSNYLLSELVSLSRVDFLKFCEKLNKNNRKMAKEVVLTETQKEIFDKISKNDVDGLKAALSQHKTTINFVDENEMTPLQHACYKGNKEAVQMLLDMVSLPFHRKYFFHSMFLIDSRGQKLLIASTMETTLVYISQRCRARQRFVFRFWKQVSIPMSLML